MARSWYVCIGDKTTGPFSTEQLIEDLKQKKIPLDATVCASGLTRFHKITEEKELAAAFEAPKPSVAGATALPMAADAACSGKKCCPMPRVAAVGTLVLSAAFWGTAAANAAGFVGVVPASLPRPQVAAGIAFGVALASLLLAFVMARKKPCACGGAGVHAVGLAGSLFLAKTVCPGLLFVSGLHVLGLIAARKVRTQASCAKPQAPTPPASTEV